MWRPNEPAEEVVSDLPRYRSAEQTTPITPPRLACRAAADHPEGLGLSAEAVRGVLLELLKLDRYERRAAAQRDQAVLYFSYRTGNGNNL